MNNKRTLIQTIFLAAAILALLLSTPSLHASPRRSLASAKKHSKSKRSAKSAKSAATPQRHKKSNSAKSKKSGHQKVKIDFSAPETSVPAGDTGSLGDEVAQPHANNRTISEPGEAVRPRGDSVDELWAKNLRDKNPSHRATQVKVAASAPAPIDDDSPDLINPVSITDESVHSNSKAAQAALRAKGSLAASATDLDESSLANFQKTKPRAKAKTKVKAIAAKTEPAKPKAVYTAAPKQVAKAEPKPVPAPVPAPEELSFDEVKNVPAKTPARPVTRAYVRHAHAVATENHLAANMRDSSESDFKFNFALENTVTMGRAYELQTKGDRNYAMKNEIFVGANHASGWGLKLSADYVTTSNDDSVKDVHEVGDPSLIIAHPTLYKDSNIDVYGRARYYAPVSASSRSAGLQHFAYYLLTDVKLPSEMLVSNAFIPRYFHQSAYADTDAFSLLFDSTEFTKKFGLVRLGLGQQTQIESHQATAPGTTAEIYPFVDFLGLSNALLEAKMYVPVFVRGAVSGAPVAASLSNVQAEFFAKLSF